MHVFHVVPSTAKRTACRIETKYQQIPMHGNADDSKPTAYFMNERR